MPATIYYDDDADLGLLEGRKVAVLGYGSQGHAHALNLKDSGVDVRVGLREGSSSWAKAEEAGLRVLTTARGVQGSRRRSWCCCPTPSRSASTARTSSRTSPSATRSRSRTASTSTSTRSARPKGVDVWMIAPEGSRSPRAPHVRRGRRRAGARRGRADETGKAQQTALAYAKGIGATRAGVLDTTFEEETETDLFGEQVVLCGGLVELIQDGFETLVEAGYQPESAYFETLHEVKLIVDLIYEGGIANMRYSISDTAEYGDMTRGPRIITDDDQGRDEEDPRRDPERRVREGVDRSRTRPAGRSSTRCAKQSAEHPIEEVGEQLRSMMPWIGAGKARPRTSPAGSGWRNPSR